MKATLEFELPKEKDALDRAMRADALESAYYDFESWLMQKKKTGSYIMNVDQIFDGLKEALESNGVSLDG